MKNTKKKSIQEIMAKNRVNFPYTVGELYSELEFLISESSDNGWTLKKTIKKLGSIYRRAKEEGKE